MEMTNCLAWKGRNRCGPRCSRQVRSSPVFGPRSVRVRGLAEHREKDHTILLATDGVWDVMDESTVFKKLDMTVRHKDYGAKRIVSDAFSAGSQDEICAIAVYLEY